LVQFGGVLEAAYLLERIGKVALVGEGLWMVFAEYPAAHFQGALVQFGGLLEAPQLTQHVGEVVLARQGVKVILAEHDAFGIEHALEEDNSCGEVTELLTLVGYGVEEVADRFESGVSTVSEPRKGNQVLCEQTNQPQGASSTCEIDHMVFYTATPHFQFADTLDKASAGFADQRVQANGVDRGCSASCRGVNESVLIQPGQGGVNHCRGNGLT
jgi:hypothetical protein